MGLFEILVKRELILECLQLSSISPLLNNACMPTLTSKLKISCMSDNMDISKMEPILPRLPVTLPPLGWSVALLLGLHVFQHRVGEHTCSIKPPYAIFRIHPDTWRTRPVFAKC